MKKLMYVAALCLALVGSPLLLAAGQNPEPPSKQQQELIEKNVMANLQHPSLEVRAGTMQLLIDIKKTWPSYDLTFAVLPMMETLKSDVKPEFRILAALTLFHLDSELGRFAVERRAKYDDSDRVAKHCAALVRYWDKKDSFSTNLLAEVSRAL